MLLIDFQARISHTERSLFIKGMVFSMEAAKQKININWKLLLISLAVPMLVALLCITLIKDDVPIYNSLNLPFFAPPSQLFGIVWSILYLLMGVSFYFVAQTDSEEKPFALSLYVVQLFFNVTWCIVFFILRTYFVAFITAVLLECLVICMVAWFLKVDKIAGILQIPYMLWVMYASMLSFGIYLLN